MLLNEDERAQLSEYKLKLIKKTERNILLDFTLLDEKT